MNQSLSFVIVKNEKKFRLQNDFGIETWIQLKQTEIKLRHIVQGNVHIRSLELI